MQGIRIFLSSKAGCCVFAFSKFQLNELNAQCQRLGEKTLLRNSFCGKWGYLKKYYEISSMDAYDNASCQIWQKFFIWMCQFLTLKGRCVSPSSEPEWVFQLRWIQLAVLERKCWMRAAWSLQKDLVWISIDHLGHLVPTWQSIIFSGYRFHATKIFAYSDSNILIYIFVF